LQAKKERRRRRRDENRKLKTWTEDAFGSSGPCSFTEESVESNNSAPDSSKSANDTMSNSTDEDRMWRRLIKQSRSSRETARLRRAWAQWQSTMDASANETESQSIYKGNEREFSDKKYSDNNNHQNNKGKVNTSTQEDWFAAWKAAFSSSSSSTNSTFSSFSNFNTDYESFWSYGGSSSSDAARRQAFAWQQKQQKQAGSTHPNFKQRFSQQQHQSSSFGYQTPNSFALSKEVRSNLSLLGLATTHLPTPIELKTAFRTSAMAWHPDRHPDPKAASTAEEKFKRVQSAFSYLKTMVVI
jgi:DnaJ domain